MSTDGGIGQAELGGRFRRGLGLSLLNTLLSRLGTFLLGVLLARLLAPEDFGLYAAALVVQMLLLTFNDLGAAASVVRHSGDVRPLLPTAWTVAVCGGTTAFALCLVAAPALAAGLGSPQATDIVRLLAANVFLDGFAAVPGALLTRELRQASRLVADLSGVVVNLALTGALALSGFGAWSLAIGHVSGTAVVVVVLLFVSRQWPRFGFDREHFGEVGRYGVTVVASGMVIVLSNAVPQVVAGSILGATALGFFYLANNVANWPVSIVSTTLERVALATFSRARDRGVDLNLAAGEVVGLVGIAVLPGGLALAILSGPIVEVVYGSAWAPAAHVLSALAIAAVARVLTDLAFHLLLAVGAPLSSALVNVSWLVALVPATVAAAMVWGLVGIGWAQAVVAFVVAVPVHAWRLHRAGISLAALAKGLAYPALAGLLAVAGLLAIRAFADSPLLDVALGAALTAAVVGVGWYTRRHHIDRALNGAAADRPVATFREGS
ncbi:oligosaccharide flippase family protein [Crossiella sp. CA-258035]|uniref:oligosaccharide flippase family protein n=1 Tax=Crossiella sp. CA-258035 TaxID=2981138 RepID=UPI0024BCF80B|nr:oligosaccharide flippase family protein [Crossiella sp. CA-258035]WHT21100.1 oligosaccharide flippase family protein [Crossiella sp. CA-258035]